MKTTFGIVAVFAVLSGFLLFSAADTLPDELSDESFWRIVAGVSEDGGPFRYENLLSNEISYQSVIPALKRIAQPGGVYLGVGPEQNFSYIAALQPKIAFIIDIRRQNMLELLMYKALFEISADRATFISKLFSRRRAGGMNVNSSAGELFKAYEAEEADSLLLNQTLQSIYNVLTQRHHFPLTMDDESIIRHVLDAFRMGGPQIDYGFVSPPSNVAAPSYSQLMTATDETGKNWSYLATEMNFQRVREMQIQNLIVPLVGDFAGNKTLRLVAGYLRKYNARVTAFYISNVEQYLQKDAWQRFHTNVSLLPANSSSTLIRFIPPASTVLESVMDFRYRHASLFHLLHSGGDASGVQSQ